MSKESEGKEHLIEVDVEMALNVSEYGVVGTVEIPEEWLGSFDSDPDIRQKIVELVRAGLDNNEFDLGYMESDYSSADGLRLLSLQRGRVRETIIEPLERNTSELGNTFMDAIAKDAVVSKEKFDDLVLNLSRWSLKNEEEVRELLKGFAHSIVHIAQQEEINKSTMSSVYRAEEQGYGGILITRSRGGVDNASLYLKPGDDANAFRDELKDIHSFVPEEKREQAIQNFLSQYDNLMFEQDNLSDEHSKGDDFRLG